MKKGQKIIEYFLEIAGFGIRLVFEPTDQIKIKERLLNEILDIWGKGGFIGKKRKNYDFEIRFASQAGRIEVFRKKGGKEHFLTLNKDYRHKKIETFYYIGILTFQLILREVLSYLLRKDGFLLHASGSLDRDGNLFIFLAPSGGGKTTLSNLLKEGGLRKFSDDILLVRKLGGKWRFFSPPFIEKEHMPLKREATGAKIFTIIKKGKKVSSKRLKREDKILKAVLGKIWTPSGKIESRCFKTATAFVSENNFYQLVSALDVKSLKEIIYEA